jgi:outer membrane immunogenic protein
MKRFLTTSASLTAMMSSVIAADLPARKEPIAVSMSSSIWTGLYAGLNAGGAWSNSSSTSVTTYPGFINYPNLSVSGTTYAPAAAWMASRTLASGYSGFIGGGQIGYNWQANQSAAIGAEADIQGIAGSGSRTGAYQLAPRANIGERIGDKVFGLISTSRNISYLGTIRGKIGYLVIPNLLVYATGGLAYGGVASNISISGAALPATGGSPFATNGSYSETRTGWTVGGGAEWMFLKDWSAKTEYLYYDLGNLSYVPSPMVSLKANGAVNFVNWSRVQTRFNGNLVRIGINYHFNLDSIPVMAKF